MWCERGNHTGTGHTHGHSSIQIQSDTPTHHDRNTQDTHSHKTTPHTHTHCTHTQHLHQRVVTHLHVLGIVHIPFSRACTYPRSDRLHIHTYKDTPLYFIDTFCTMPELPEVEATRKLIESEIQGQTIKTIDTKEQGTWVSAAYTCIHR